MPYIIEKQQVDFEGYAIGKPNAQVGPFDSPEEAQAWLESHPAYTHNSPQFNHSIDRGAVISIVDPFQWVTPPDDPRWA